MGTNPIIQRMIGITYNEHQLVAKEAIKQTEIEGRRVSESEIVRKAIDFYFSNRSE